jgi:hypothetical protein
VIVTGQSLVSDYSFFFKMAARFAVVTEQEIAKIKEDSIPKKPKQVTKYGLKIFQGKILNFTCFYLEKNWLSRNATQSRV